MSKVIIRVPAGKVALVIGANWTQHAQICKRYGVDVTIGERPVGNELQVITVSGGSHQKRTDAKKCIDTLTSYEDRWTAAPPFKKLYVDGGILAKYTFHPKETWNTRRAQANIEAFCRACAPYDVTVVFDSFRDAGAMDKWRSRRSQEIENQYREMVGFLAQQKTNRVSRRASRNSSPR